MQIRLLLLGIIPEHLDTWIHPSCLPGYPVRKAYPTHPYTVFIAGQAPPPAHNLGIIPEHLAEGIAELDAGRDEGLDSGTNHSADQTVYHIDVERYYRCDIYSDKLKVVNLI